MSLPTLPLNMEQTPQEPPSNTSTNPTDHPPPLPSHRILSSASNPYKQSSNTDPTITKFTDIIVTAFQNAYLTTGIIVEIDQTPPPYPAAYVLSQPRRREHFGKFISEAAASGATLVEAGNWSAVALWEPPDFKTDFSQRPNPGPLLREWKTKIMEAKIEGIGAVNEIDQRLDDEQAKLQVLSSPETENHVKCSSIETPRLKPFYHLAFLARNPSFPPVPGAIRSVLSPLFEAARTENVAVWLEADNPKARDLYRYHFGFRLVREVTLGEGVVDDQGWPVLAEHKGRAVGMKGWCMTWDDHLRKT